MRFLTNLLPLLLKSPSPRVLTVLGGGMEGPIFADDLPLASPKHYTVANAANVAATYTTSFLEALHARNPKISFVHLFPGLTKTKLWNNSDHFAAWQRFLINWIVFPLISPFLFSTAQVSGQRALFAATNGRFRALKPGMDPQGTLMAEGSDGKKGSGVYTVNQSTEGVHADKVLAPLRQQGMVERIWDFTWEEFRRAAEVHE